MSILKGVDCPGRADNLEKLRGTDQQGPGLYLTDEVFLYRLVELIRVEEHDVVELEDCYLLDVVHVSGRDLRARRLRVVTPNQTVPARSSSAPSRRVIDQVVGRN